MNILEYDTVIIDHCKCEPEEYIEYSENKYLSFTFLVAINIKNCGEIINNEIHIDVERLEKYSHLLYDTCIKNEIIAHADCSWPKKI